MKIMVINNKLKTSILIVLLISTVSLMIYFISFKYLKYAFHSDSAFKILLANEIYVTKYLFPQNVYFVNFDIWIFGAHTFLILLKNYIVSDKVIYVLNAVIWYILILASAWQFLKKISSNINDKITVVLIIASGVSLPITEHLFGQISYGPMLFFVFLIFTLIFSTLESNRIYKNILIITTFIILSSGNPSRVFIFLFVPLALALLLSIIIYKNNKKENVIKKIKIVIISFGGLLIGWMTHKLILSELSMNSGYVEIKWVTFDSSFSKLIDLIGEVLSYIGISPRKGNLVTNLSGVYEFFKMSIGILYLIMTPIAVLRSLKSENFKIIFIALFALISFGIPVFIMLTTDMPVAARYIITPMILSLILIVLVNIKFKDEPVLYIIKYIFIFGLLTNVLAININIKNNNYWSSHFYNEAEKVGVQTHDDNIYELSEFLVKNNLKYGYASFWSAGVISVLSDGKVLVRQIIFKNQLPEPHLWLSSSDWYRPSYYAGESFLLLTDWESNNINWTELEKKYKVIPTKKLKFTKYNIYIFDDNISEKLTYWDRILSHSEINKKGTRKLVNPTSNNSFSN
jgi:hypothetical protein